MEQQDGKDVAYAESHEGEMNEPDVDAEAEAEAESTGGGGVEPEAEAETGAEAEAEAETDAGGDRPKRTPRDEDDPFRFMPEN